MNDLSTVSGQDYSADDELLAQFVQEIERCGGEGVRLEDWVARAGHLESRMRQLHLMYRALEGSRPEAESPIPDRLGEFRIVRRLPGGHLGEVYEAIQEPLHRRVAVKTIRRGRISPELQARFLREQQVLASLHQTHIIPIHTAGYDGGLQFFAMPYIDGAALSHVVAMVNELQSSNPGSRTPGLKELARAATKNTAAADVPTVTRVGDIDLSRSKNSTVAASQRRRLSSAYTRSVSQLMADVAEAVHYAHQQGILHRDIKPSNIMIDQQEQGWIIDFGLARHLNEAGTKATAKPVSISAQAERNGVAEADLTVSAVPEADEAFATRGMIGTPSYMAPEQFAGESDARSDVWGLGATLYELLTLQRPFTGQEVSAIERAVREEAPQRPRSLVEGVPADLEAICLKAMQKEPAKRYQTAVEFAVDLQRFLRDEPIRARFTLPHVRCWKWARRNKGLAVAVMAIGMAIVIGVVAALAFERNQFLSGESRRQGLITDALLVRRTTPQAGWSGTALKLMQDANAIRPGGDVRDAAAASLAGLDILRSHNWEFRSSSVAFNKDESQLLIGGSEGHTRLWTRATDTFQESQLPGAGPVTFAANGDGLHWTADSPWSFVLWHVFRQEAVCKVQAPPSDGFQPPNDTALITRLMSRVTLALSADGALVAASVPKPDEHGHWPDDSGETLVWNDRGELVQQIAGAATALRFSPDNSLLGLGRANGDIDVMSLLDGRKLSTLNSSRTRIHCLDFKRSPASNDKMSNWLLAAGDAAGAVVIWDVTANVPLSRCLGSSWDVLAVCFSPDGMTLASGGRSGARLWDCYTGRPILHIPDTGDYISALAYSNDGAQLAISSAAPGTNKHGTTIWSIKRGRGIDLLNGLTSQVVHTCWSPDGSLIAALGQNWDIGVFEVNPPRLKYLLEGPLGFTADNAALAISPDNKSLAASAGGNVKLWSLDNGRLTASHDLPQALVDQLAFTTDGKLLSFRCECQDGVTAPMSDAHPKAYPRVLRLRNLLAADPLQPMAEITRFNWHVYCAVAHPQGKFFVAAGLHRNKVGDAQEIIAIDGSSGLETWKHNLGVSAQTPFLLLDSTGSTVGFNESALSHPVQARLPAVDLINQAAPPAHALGSNGETTLSVGTKRIDGTWANAGVTLFHRNRPEPTVILGIDFVIHPISPRFSPDGQRLALGTSEGMVAICDLAQVRQRLSELGFSP